MKIENTRNKTKFDKKKNPRNCVSYRDFVMIFLSIFIFSYLTSSKINTIDYQQLTNTWYKYED